MSEEKEYKPFEKRIWLSSPTMHGEEMEFVQEAYDTNWMSTIGKNIDEVEKIMSEYVGVGYGVALSCGTSALHMAVRLAGVKPGDKVFCSDLTFSATVNPIVYEGGVPVFIDSEYTTWNMDPWALKKAFEIYPDVRVVMLAHLYGTPAQVDEIRKICDEHGAILIEDAAESLGAAYRGKQTGSFGDISAISFNGNKIITGSAGGMLLTDDEEAAARVRKWSTQSRETAPWYQHEELGYNYRMSNVIAGIVRGQALHLQEHIDRKKEIFVRYRDGFAQLPISMNHFYYESEPNFWLSCMLIDDDGMCYQKRDDLKAVYRNEHGYSCPTQILESLARINAEGRPIWKPMHMQPVFRENEFITLDGVADKNHEFWCADEDIFNRGLCLPSDIKMTNEEQDTIIEVVKNCFK